MAKTLRKTNGQFNGSLGAGAKQVPTAAPTTGSVSTSVDGVAPSFPTADRLTDARLRVQEQRTRNQALVRLWAESDRTDAQVLEVLADDPSPEMRRLIATNPSTPTAVLTRLVEDSDEDVRVAVLANPRTPVEVLTRLADSPNERVRVCLAGNTSTPGEVLRRLVTDDTGSLNATHAAARNPHTPSDVLNTIARDADRADWMLRFSVASNPNTPVSTLEALLVDPVAHVRQKAAQHPRASEVDEALWVEWHLSGYPGDYED